MDISNAYTVLDNEWVPTTSIDTHAYSRREDSGGKGVQVRAVRAGARVATTLGSAPERVQKSHNAMVRINTKISITGLRNNARDKTSCSEIRGS